MRNGLWLFMLAVAAVASCRCVSADELSDLHSAIIDGDVAKVEKMIGANVDLVNAVEKIDPHSVHKPSFTDCWAPLHYAVHFDRKAIAELLIAKGADVNASAGAATPMGLAAEERRVDLALVLIAHKADINGKCRSPNVTPLQDALIRGHLGLAKMLAEKGAALDIFSAAGLGKEEFVRRCLEQEPAAARCTNVVDLTPLHLAAAGGQERVAELLLVSLASVDATGGDWESTPLGLAARFGHKEVVAVLIAHKADVNKTDSFGETPLYRAKTAQVAEVLLKAGARTDHVSVLGMTPLHLAAYLGNTALAESLIAHKADLNARCGPDNMARPCSSAFNPEEKDLTGSQFTPLYEAVWGCRKDMVELLVRAGADINAKDAKGRTPLGLAAEEGHKEIVELLRKHGGK